MLNGHCKPQENGTIFLKNCLIHPGLRLIINSPEDLRYVWEKKNGLCEKQSLSN